jgi:predicted amidohydrolase YtcJ
MTEVCFNNAVIWAGTPPQPTRGWLHVRDGVIAAVGAGEPPACVDARDLSGQHILPGFVDAHSHLTVSAWMPRTIDASGWRSATDVVRDISKEVSVRPEATWLLAMDADFDLFKGRYPRPDDLDHAAGGRPLVIADFSLHRSLLSATALRFLSDIGYAGNPDMDHRSGRPTGMVWESAHAAALRMALDSLARAIGDHGRRGLLDREAERHLACGITACHDPCVPPSQVGELEALRQRSPLRLSWSMVSEAGMLAPATQSEVCGCCGEGPASAKLFMDGAHRCALCLDPRHVLHMMGRAAAAAFRGDMRPIAGLTAYKSVYRDAAFHMPYLRMETADLAKRLEMLASHGVRPKIHAVGNHAASCAADALVEAGRPSATLEHLTFLSDRDVGQVARATAVASMQPGFISRFGSGILDRGITPRLRAYPIASLRRAGVAVALSSDNPCGPLAPLSNIRMAVSRQLADGRVVDASEAISLADAIEAYTIIGHKAVHGHPGLGIAVGAVADLAILSGDPLAAATQVIQTWIAGQQAWNAADC